MENRVILRIFYERSILFHQESQKNVFSSEIATTVYIFGYHGNPYSYDLYEKWAKVGIHDFKF